MFLNSVILTLREVLEAAFIISIFFFLSRRFEISTKWVALGIFSGLLGSFLYGINVSSITSSYEGIGQEIFNATTQIIIFLLLLISVFYMVVLYRQKSSSKTILQAIFVMVSTLAISREGSEIYLYVSAFKSQESVITIVFAGSFLGACIGFSVGALLFFTLNQLSDYYTLRAALPLVVMVGSGMCIQASQLLMQSDLLPSGMPLWDTNHLIDENSVIGQLLYAAFGYESSPSLIEVIAYCGALSLFIVAIAASYRLISETQ